MGKMQKGVEKKTKTLDRILKEPKKAVIMVELPTNAYFDTNANNIKTMVQKGFEGVYISSQRPFRNVFSLLKAKGVDTSKLWVVDAISACEGAPEKNQRCISISKIINVDETVRAIYTMLSKLTGKKIFIFIDSLTTMALYMQLSEIMRFCEFLMDTVAKQDGKRVILVFNVAKELAQKEFIQDIALRVDETIIIEKDAK
jgi:KaiC/GvpD/RAD55 family RecA-like ATPase